MGMPHTAWGPLVVYFLVSGRPTSMRRWGAARASCGATAPEKNSRHKPENTPQSVDRVHTTPRQRQLRGQQGGMSEPQVYSVRQALSNDFDGRNQDHPNGARAWGKWSRAVHLPGGCRSVGLCLHRCCCAFTVAAGALRTLGGVLVVQKEGG